MKRLPLYISFLLFVALSVSITFWLLVWMAPAPRPLRAPEQTQPALPSLSSASHLFGSAVQAVSTMPVQLKGIIRAGKARDSVAIISVEGRPARALRENDELMEGLLLKKINLTSVLLSDHGVEREIPLPEFQVNAAAQSLAPVDGAPIR